LLIFDVKYRKTKQRRRLYQLILGYIEGTIDLLNSN
jgi:hypothetical protein